MYDDILLNGNTSQKYSTKSHSSFDDLFNNLNADIANVNNFIYSLNNKRKENKEEEQELLEERDKLNQDKIDFENYVKKQKVEISKRQEQVNQYLNTQKSYLYNANEEFRTNMQRSLMELDIAKKELELEKQRFNEEKNQFESYKELELNRIHNAEEILESEKNQFERYKDINNKRIELETKELEQKCARFKNIVGQFNTNFKPLIESNEE